MGTNRHFFSHHTVVTDNHEFYVFHLLKRTARHLKKAKPRKTTCDDHMFPHVYSRFVCERGRKVVILKLLYVQWNSQLVFSGASARTSHPALRQAAPPPLWTHTQTGKQWHTRWRIYNWVQYARLMLFILVCVFSRLSTHGSVTVGLQRHGRRWGWCQDGGRGGEAKGGGLWHLLHRSDGKPYPLPLSHRASEGKLFFWVCEAWQLCPAGRTDTGFHIHVELV